MHNSQIEVYEEPTEGKERKTGKEKWKHLEDINFSIALKNRYQVLEDEGLAIKEEDEEIECDFQHVQEWKPHQ